MRGLPLLLVTASALLNDDHTVHEERMRIRRFKGLKHKPGEHMRGVSMTKGTNAPARGEHGGHWNGHHSIPSRDAHLGRPLGRERDKRRREEAREAGRAKGRAAKDRASRGGLR
jgi:hypothetical protein